MWGNYCGPIWHHINVKFTTHIRCNFSASVYMYEYQLSKVIWIFHHCNTFRRYCGKMGVEHKTLQAVFVLTKQHTAYHKWKHLKNCRTARYVEIFAGHLRCLRKPQMNGKRKAPSKKLYPNKRRQHYVIQHQFLKCQGCAFSLSLKNDFGKDSYFFVIFKIKSVNPDKSNALENTKIVGAYAKTLDNVYMWNNVLYTVVHKFR